MIAWLLIIGAGALGLGASLGYIADSPAGPRIRTAWTAGAVAFVAILAAAVLMALEVTR